MVNLVQDIKPISYVKSHTADVMKQIEEKNNITTTGTYAGFTPWCYSWNNVWF